VKSTYNYFLFTKITFFVPLKNVGLFDSDVIFMENYFALIELILVDIFSNSNFVKRLMNDTKWTE